MDYLKRFLINLAILVGFGLIIYIASPKIMGLVFQSIYGLFGPLAFLFLIGAALPARRKKKSYANVNRRPDNVAGASTQKMADKRYTTMVVYGFTCFGICALIMVMVNNAKFIGIGSIGILILIFAMKIIPELFLKRIDVKSKEVNRARKGADAEERVDDLFASLSDQYFIINDVVSKSGNIDHVIIKKGAGILLIETKSHHGKISVQDKTIYLNGHLPEKDFITQTLSNTYWLRDKVKLLIKADVWINPIIVFTNAFVPFVPPVRGIQLVNIKYLLSTLDKMNHNNPLNEQLWEKREEIFQILKA